MPCARCRLGSIRSHRQPIMQKAKHPPDPPMTVRLFANSMVAATVCLAATASNGRSTSTRLSCDGQLIEPISKATSPKALQLTIGSGKVGVDFGNGNIAAKVESNNDIQLKFNTDEFLGEYFHYTNDLFLI